MKKNPSMLGRGREGEREGSGEKKSRNIEAVKNVDPISSDVPFYSHMHCSLPLEGGSGG